MDNTSSKFYPSESFFPHNEKASPLPEVAGFYKKNKDIIPPADAFPDPLCNLNLKETSEFVRSFPMSNSTTEPRGFVQVSAHQRKREGANSVTQRRIETPSTPGRPVFSFSIPRKSIPSKWDDADKWLNSNSCHESPAHPVKLSSHHHSKVPKPCDEMKHQKDEDDNDDVFAEKCRGTDAKVSKTVSSFRGSVSFEYHHHSTRAFNGVSASSEVFLKDKFTEEVEPIVTNIRYSEPSKEGFMFKNSMVESMEDHLTEVVHEVQLKDVGTEMTPLASSTTTRCNTPFKSSSPARHNTPANRSGPLALPASGGRSTSIDISQLHECHFAKLQLGTQYDSVTSNWSSREEEEEEVSKSLRHFEMSNNCRKSFSESQVAAWEEEERTKHCLRYQREEAKIQAWVNLQNAKAEAQSRKLEVKIQKMKSNLEEKQMKRMAVVHRKAEEWRAAARQQHTEQMRKATAQSHKIITASNSRFAAAAGHTSCGCFPCTSTTNLQ